MGGVVAKPFPIPAERWNGFMPELGQDWARRVPLSAAILVNPIGHLCMSDQLPWQMAG